LEQLRERLAKFGLELHPEKTRQIEFGRFATENRRKRGEGKPETFNFLGLARLHPALRFLPTSVGRTTRRANSRATGRRSANAWQPKLKDIRAQLCKRMHARVSGTVKWLQQVVRGYFAVKRLEDAGPFGLVPGEFPAESAGGIAYLISLEQAVFEPVLEFTRGEPSGCAEFGGVHVIGILTPSRRAG
jgi:hypothetical protein